MPELEALLNDHLGSVSAPRELWDRVHTPREPRSARSRGANRMAWIAASAVLVMASVVGLHEQLRGPALKQPGQPPRFQAWVKSGTGLDLHGACGLCHID